MTRLAFLFAALATFGTVSTAEARPQTTRPQVETTARPAATTRPAARPAPRPAASRVVTRAPVVTPRVDRNRVRMVRVQRRGRWVYSPPGRLVVGRLLWVDDRRASVVRLEAGRALVEYHNGVRSWIRIG